MTFSRRQRLAVSAVALGSALGAAWLALGPRGAAAEDITVWPAPGCGCCHAWVAHLEAEGFAVTVQEGADMAAVKALMGVPAELQSCHTAEVAGYAVEGHVPAADIRRLLAERPAAVGLAVPGMPVGSPGMEMGDRRDPYEVILFDGADTQSVFAHH